MQKNLKGGFFARRQPQLLEVRKSIDDLHSEHQHQCGVIHWARWGARLLQHTHPLVSLALRWLHAIPNGLFLGPDRQVAAALGKKAVAAGLTAGVADLFLPFKTDEWPGLYIEMKAGRNDLDDHQKDFRRDITLLGYKHVVCYSFREAAAEIVAYLGPAPYPPFA